MGRESKVVGFVDLKTGTVITPDGTTDQFAAQISEVFGRVGRQTPVDDETEPTDEGE